ncbi:Protein of unknown function [Gryllus bimaculatus]|nr:Protein of unknown function [Gryllus bimaculatus]
MTAHPAGENYRDSWSTPKLQSVNKPRNFDSSRIFGQISLNLYNISIEGFDVPMTVDDWQSFVLYRTGDFPGYNSHIKKTHSLKNHGVTVCSSYREQIQITNTPVSTVRRNYLNNSSEMNIEDCNVNSLDYAEVK